MAFPSPVGSPKTIQTSFVKHVDKLPSDTINKDQLPKRTWDNGNAGKGWEKNAPSPDLLLLQLYGPKRGCGEESERSHRPFLG